MRSRANIYRQKADQCARAAMKVADPQVQVSYRQYDLAIGLPCNAGALSKAQSEPTVSSLVVVHEIFWNVWSPSVERIFWRKIAGGPIAIRWDIVNVG